MTSIVDPPADIAVPAEGDSTHILDSGRRGFPVTKEDFDEDERVSFSRISGKYTLEQEDGSEFEYDEALKRWISILDENLAEQQSKAYAVEGVDETEQVTPRNKNKKKRKNEASNDANHIQAQQEQQSQDEPHKKHKKNGKPDSQIRVNRAVYVTNLPLDVTTDEINTLFGRCGVIAEELEGGKPRIKIYTDEQGQTKGDALVVYFKPESVKLAIQILDDTDFRFGVDTGAKIKVQAADNSYKVHHENTSIDKKSAKEKKKIIAKTQKLNNKLADWDDDDPSAMNTASSRWDKVVILKHMFTLQELDEDPAAILDVKEEIREECAKLGEVTNVTLYDKEDDGVASVRFAMVESAKACISLMNGRFFGGQQVEAYIYDGVERFKKSGKGGAKDDETEEADRLDKFGSWLESEGA